MKTVVANWKMNGSKKLVDSFKAESKNFENFDCEVVLCPPFIYLEKFIDCFANSGVKFGAQNCSNLKNGALTGEISCEILADLNCQFVIIGHSERRKFFNEKNDEIAGKIKMARGVNMTSILCVGESAQQRDTGEVEAVLESQLEVLEAVPNILSEDSEQLIIAYEPVWAIGTGLTPSLQEIDEAHIFIKQTLERVFTGKSSQIKVLYGGSVNTSNALGLFALENVDGGLIGGASLEVSSFKELCAIASLS